MFFPQVLPQKTGFGDVGCRAGLGCFSDFNFFGGSAAECEYAADFTEVTQIILGNVEVYIF